MHRISIENHKILIYIVHKGVITTYFTVYLTIYVERRTLLNIKCTQFWENMNLFST